MPRVEHSIKVEAVVLRHSDYGEADRLLTLYSREQGKLRAIAKGVRKMQSRKAGHLEPFTQVALMLAKGHDMWIVTQAEAIEPLQPLREDLTRIGYAGYVVELLDRFTYEEARTGRSINCCRDTQTPCAGRGCLRAGALLRDAPAGPAGFPSPAVRVRRLREGN